MSNLDNLIKKILSDCEEKSGQIIKSADEQASEILRDYISAAEKEKEQILTGAKLEADKTAEQIVLSKKLEIRDENLNAKRQTINKVFDHALNKLNNMKKNEFMDFLRKSLLSLSLKKDETEDETIEIILPSKYEINSLEEINAFLKKNNKNGNLVLYKGDRKIDGGFILINEGIEKNNTFETLIEFYRYELESELISKLF